MRILAFVGSVFGLGVLGIFVRFLETISKLKSASLRQFETTPSPQPSPAGRGSFEIVSERWSL